MTATTLSVLADRPRAWLFWLGSALVTIGVALHLPMFWMGRGAGFRLAGMAMDPAMIWGMAAIVGGIVLAAFGLLPVTRTIEPANTLRVIQSAELRPAHWRLMGVLTLALVIDVMKPASLGFVVPGMVQEYGVSKATVAWLPFAALAGTVAGSLLWGWLADMFGRRASILLSSVMFVGTSICGAMPDFWWNVGMCFLMGAAAGGMLPVAYALLAEMMPPRHRSWGLVLVGGLGGVGGYLAASSLSGLLQPVFGWRIMWLLNLPTGLVLVLLSGLIPESIKFLLQVGREAEARAGVGVFGASLAPAPSRDAGAGIPGAAAVKTGGLLFTVLSAAALTWGLVNFGLLLWLPAELAARGFSRGRDGEAAGEFRADRAADGGGRRARLQPLEHARYAGGVAGGHADGPGRRHAVRKRTAGERGRAGRVPDHRLERATRRPAAVYGRDRECAGARAGDRLGGGLHQGGRAVRASARHPGRRPRARPRRAADHRADDHRGGAGGGLRPGDARARTARSDLLSTAGRPARARNGNACPAPPGRAKSGAMRLIFMGTPAFAVPALDALVAAGHEVAAVYTQPPRRADRGRVAPSAVQARADALGLPVHCPATLRDAEVQAGFAALRADAAVVAAYGLILPRAVLDRPAHGCWNVHASLLPRWRGAAPIQRAILAGDAETGVTIMRMEPGLDTGPMAVAEATPVAGKTAGRADRPSWRRWARGRWPTWSRGCRPCR